MNLYTEQQLHEICHEVAERVISTSLPKARTKELVQYYGRAHIWIDNCHLDSLEETDDCIQLTILDVVKNHLK